MFFLYSNFVENITEISDQDKAKNCEQCGSKLKWWSVLFVGSNNLFFCVNTKRTISTNRCCFEPKHLYWIINYYWIDSWRGYRFYPKQNGKCELRTVGSWINCLLISWISFFHWNKNQYQTIIYWTILERSFLRILYR